MKSFTQKDIGIFDRLRIETHSTVHHGEVAHVYPETGLVLIAKSRPHFIALNHCKKVCRIDRDGLVVSVMEDK